MAWTSGSDTGGLGPGLLGVREEAGPGLSGLGKGGGGLNPHSEKEDWEVKGSNAHVPANPTLG